MKKELEESLKHIQSHPTTGTPHNQQLISTQVETIFALDRLENKIKKLNKTIEAAEKQNQRLEESNYKLQKVMLILTAITTTIATFPVFAFLIKLIAPLVTNLLNIASISIALTSVLAALTSLIIGVLTYKYEKVFTEKITLKDRLQITLMDKDGKVKDMRSQE